MGSRVPLVSSPPAQPAPQPFSELHLGDDLSAVVQNMVRTRIARNWPLVRAHELRTQGAHVGTGDWLVVRGPETSLWVGRALQQGPQGTHVCSRIGPAILVEWFEHTHSHRSMFVSSLRGWVPSSAVLAVGFHMEVGVKLSRRHGRKQSFVMPSEVQHLLSPMMHGSCWGEAVVMPTDGCASYYCCA